MNLNAIVCFAILLLHSLDVKTQNNAVITVTGTSNTVTSIQKDDHKEIVEPKDTLLKETDPHEVKTVVDERDLVDDTNNLFVMLISIATFIGLVWAALPHIKKMLRKK